MSARLLDRSGYSMCHWNLSPGVADRLRRVSSKDLIFAVPDLHGRADIAWAVIKLLEHIKARQVVFLGDYIGKNACPLTTVDLVISARTRNKGWVALRGNHEQTFIEASETETAALDVNGRFQSVLPADQKKYAEVFRSLPVFHSTKALLFVHGGVNKSYRRRDVRKIPERELLWSYKVHSGWRGKKIVRGHAPVPKPIERSNNVALETEGWIQGRRFIIGILQDVPSKKALLGWIELSFTAQLE